MFYHLTINRFYWYNVKEMSFRSLLTLFISKNFKIRTLNFLVGILKLNREGRNDILVVY
jgi:hypothetical protein